MALLESILKSLAMGYLLMSRQGDENDTESDDDLSEEEIERLKEDAEELKQGVNNWEASEYEQPKD